MKLKELASILERNQTGLLNEISRIAEDAEEALSYFIKTKNREGLSIIAESEEINPKLRRIAYLEIGNRQMAENFRNEYPENEINIPEHIKGKTIDTRINRGYSGPSKNSKVDREGDEQGEWSHIAYSKFEK